MLHMEVVLPITPKMASKTEACESHMYAFIFRQILSLTHLRGAEKRPVERQKLLFHMAL